MSDDLISGVRCGEPACDYQFPEGRQAFQAARRPCPLCGSTVRHAFVTGSLTAVGEVSMSGIGFRHSKTKWFAKFHDKTELFRRTSRTHRVNRMLNRRTNQYDELITDAETGVVVREVHEPLTDHQGHGSARRDESTS